MREYKFRAWNKKKREMIYLYPNDTILFKNGKCTVWKENQYDETEECFCCETFSDVIPMLCLGRKDKNKEEIYEGDIVLYDNLNGAPTIGLLYGFRNIHGNIDKQKFEVIWMQDGYCLRELKHKYILDGIWWELTEKIGNIHENPELLKEESEVEEG